jgi:hypothetical protein
MFLWRSIAAELPGSITKGTWWPNASGAKSGQGARSAREAVALTAFRSDGIHDVPHMQDRSSALSVPAAAAHIFRLSYAQ